MLLALLAQTTAQSVRQTVFRQLQAHPSKAGEQAVEALMGALTLTRVVGGLPLLALAGAVQEAGVWQVWGQIVLAA
jgi:hypothetical protein